LADAVGIDFTYLSKLENDQMGQSPGEELVRRLATALGEDAEDLLAAAGKVPIESLRDRAGRDAEFARFLRKLPALPEKQLRRLMRAANNPEKVKRG